MSIKFAKDDNLECGNNDMASICEVYVKYSTELFKLIHLHKAKWVILVVEGERIETRLVEMHHEEKYKKITQFIMRDRKRSFWSDFIAYI